MPPYDPRAATSRRRDDDREGSRAALYILLGFLLVALLGGGAYLMQNYLFEQPPDEVRVPNLIGLSEKQARDAVVDAGLRVGDVSYEPSEDAEQDRVIEQEPNRDEFVEDGTAVDFVVSSGKPMVSVPSVVGQQRDAARSATDRRRDCATSARSASPTSPQGQVLETDPAAGESVPEGTPGARVLLRRARAGARRGGADRAAGRVATLRDAGFEVFTTTTTETTEPKGTVVRQNPPAGSEWPEGTSITIEVSAFEPEPTPTETAHRAAPDRPHVEPDRPDLTRGLTARLVHSWGESCGGVTPV